MEMYQKVLVAVELNEETDEQVIQKASYFLQKNIPVYLFHSVEHMSSYGVAYGVSAGIDIEEELRREAKENMRKLGASLNIPEKQQVVHCGPAKFLIIEEAKKIKADLIVVGSHGRHGVGLLLGSTANAVLHHATCDVLAVRLKG